MKRKQSVSIERALSRTRTKRSAGAWIAAWLDLRTPATSEQRPHWLHLPPLTA